MKGAVFVPLLAGLGHALPQAPRSCHTTTKRVIVPTSTATYLSTHVTTVPATAARDLGTFTDVVRLSSTRTMQTLTNIETECTANGTVTAQPTATIYTTANSTSEQSSSSEQPSGFLRPGIWNHLVQPRQDADCTVTETSTTTYGQTYTFAPASETSTFTRFTEFAQATVTSTTSGFTAYAIATAATSIPGECGPTVNATSPTTTSTTTQDARCAPTALISAAGPSETSDEFGLLWAEGPSTGTTWQTNTTDASACCQLCVEAEECATSSWDIRTGGCELQFPVRFDSGELSCGLGLQAYYGAGPNHPMEPGTGLFVAEVCGSAVFANAKPDDGT